MNDESMYENNDDIIDIQQTLSEGTSHETSDSNDEDLNDRMRELKLNSDFIDYNDTDINNDTSSEASAMETSSDDSDDDLNDEECIFPDLNCNNHLCDQCYHYQELSKDTISDDIIDNFFSFDTCSFELLCGEITQNFSSHMRISKKAVIILQTVCEDMVVEYFL